MKTTPYQIYTDKKKEIFNNLFISQADNSRKKFESYANEFFKTLQGNKKPSIKTVREEDMRCSQHKVTTIKNPEKISYNTHHMLWEARHKDNLVTHFLCESDFNVTNSNLYSLNVLHPDWNHQNKNCHNTLILLAIRKNLDLLVQVANDFNLDLNKKDKDHKYFTHFLFSEIPSERLGFNFFSSLNGNFTHIEKLIDENPQHFKVSHVRLERIINEWENTMQKLRDDFAIDENFNKYTVAISDIQSHRARILTKILNHKLDVTLPSKDESSKKSASVKI